MIKNIIFDFGKVLVDFDQRYLYHSIFDDKSEMEYFLNNVCTHDWNSSMDLGKSCADAVKDLQAVYPKYSNEIQTFIDKWDVMLGDILKENVLVAEKLLKNDYKVYGLTNWSIETIHHFYRKCPLVNSFHGIVVSSEEGVIKPNAELYKILLERYNLKAEESVFIDDRIDNIETAGKLGFNTIHYQENTNLEELLNTLRVYT
ncbi:HAD family phosphatase [uncultured Draconibacterium sp.]|uniref:HAD family hydrolase n=1 Tax=uncultured Draconibacterium sp. TaxID=1573823 RepID=UPI0032180AAA